MRISWNTESLGTLHATVEDSKVMEFLGALDKLGFTAEVSLDNTDEK